MRDMNLEIETTALRWSNVSRYVIPKTTGVKNLQLSVEDILRIIWRHKILLVCAFIVGNAVVLLASLLVTPVFEAESFILARADRFLEMDDAQQRTNTV